MLYNFLMKKKMKILLSSQDFWYWPTTQMFSFIKHLLLYWFSGEIYIKNNASSRIFYHNFIQENVYENIFLVESFDGDYDKYVWFYDPQIIFVWKKKKKPTIFLCNLPFLWNDVFVQKYPSKIGLEDIDFQEINNHHELMILWYLLADKIFIRSTDGIDIKWILYQAIKDKTTLIWPIIYPKIYKSKQSNYSIIQLGWQINPLAKQSFHKTYLRLIHTITKNIQWLKKIIINPELLSLAKSIFHDNNYQLISTVGQLEYQKLLSNSSLLLAPFWINTFFESSYFNIPTIILPEQHLWHIKSLIHYIWDVSKIKYDNFLLYNIDKYTLDYTHEKDFINFLEERYWELLHGWPEQKQDVHRKTTNIINILKLDQYINKDIEKLLIEFC